MKPDFAQPVAQPSSAPPCVETARPAAPVLDLAMNEGEPPPQECFDLLRRLGPGILRDYGDPAPLEKAYAAYLGVGPERVLATTGADDAIDRVCRAWLDPDRELVHLVPTFYMIPAYARMARGRLAALDYEWGTFPRDLILGAVGERTGLVIVVSPDNPTGRAFPADELAGLARDLPEGVPLVVDRAYAEFGNPEDDAVLTDLPNVLQIRTMSKCWGLAGLRIGFVVGAQERIAAVRGFGGPYPLSGPALVLGRDRLERGQTRMRKFVAYVRAGRERLAALVRETGGAPHPSSTNFVLARYPADGAAAPSSAAVVDDSGAQWVLRGLAAQGVRVRHFEHLPGFVRITVPRNDSEFDRLERAMRCLTRPEAVLFDMDGVLADVSRSYREAIVVACASFGVRADPTAIEAAKARGHANDDWALTRTLLAEAGVSASLAQNRRRFEKAYQGTDSAPGLHRRETLVPDREHLAALAHSFKLGVVTGRPRQDAERFLDEHRIRGLFGAVVCREDAPLKPDPAPVHVAMTRLGARSAWMLGDTPDDVNAARRAGVVPIGVLAPGAGNGMHRALDQAGAARVVRASADFEGALP